MAGRLCCSLATLLATPVFFSPASGATRGTPRLRAAPQQKALVLNAGGGVIRWLLKDLNAPAPKNKDTFLENCNSTVGRVLPAIRNSYTMEQLPRVLVHDCEVYSTQEDFQHGSASLGEASRACRHFAVGLAQAYAREGKKNTTGWCNEVYTYLSTEHPAMPEPLPAPPWNHHNESTPCYVGNAATAEPEPCQPVDEAEELRKQLDSVQQQLDDAKGVHESEAERYVRERHARFRDLSVRSTIGDSERMATYG